MRRRKKKTVKKIQLQQQTPLPLVWAILFPSESDKVAVHTSKNVNEPTVCRTTTLHMCINRYIHMYKYIHKTNCNSLTQIVFGDNQFFSARRNLKSTLSLRALLQAENQLGDSEDSSV